MLVGRRRVTAMNDPRFVDRELVVTGDGSHSLYLPGCDEHYHSVHGALRESLHVFIRHGYDHVIAAAGGRVRILEVGFGTGLNALLTWERTNQGSADVEYTAVEPFPLAAELVLRLNHADSTSTPLGGGVFAAMHGCAWGTGVRLGDRFSLVKLQTRIEDFSPGDDYDLVYFDAFSPPVQPELWTLEIFDKLQRCMRRGGVLVTYCAKGAVKRNLRAVGFAIENPPGPPGKREITRATKR